MQILQTPFTAHPHHDAYLDPILYIGIEWQEWIMMNQKKLVNSFAFLKFEDINNEGTSIFFYNEAEGYIKSTRSLPECFSDLLYNSFLKVSFVLIRPTTPEITNSRKFLANWAKIEGGGVAIYIKKPATTNHSRCDQAPEDVLEVSAQSRLYLQALCV